MYEYFASLRHIGKDAFIFCHVVLSLKHSASSNRDFDSWYFFLLLLQLLIAYLQYFNQEEKRKRLETLSICQQNYVL